MSMTDLGKNNTHRLEVRAAHRCPLARELKPPHSTSTSQVATVPGLSDKLWDIPAKPRALTDSFATLPRDEQGAYAREELDMRVTRKSRAPGLTRCEDPLEVLAPFRSLGQLRQELLAKNRHASILVIKNATNYVLTLQEAVLDRGDYGR